MASIEYTCALDCMCQGCKDLKEFEEEVAQKKRKREEEEERVKRFYREIPVPSLQTLAMGVYINYKIKKNPDCWLSKPKSIQKFLRDEAGHV